MIFYLWGKIPIILMFINGYLVYRLFVVSKLTDIFFYKSIQKSKGKVSFLMLYIILSSALLSFFIPNAVTILILIPILKTIDSDIISQTNYNITTPLTLSSIYGANIGGMGSLIGSPANLILIGALDLYKVYGRENITFLNWFIWSIPLVCIFIFIAFIIILFNIPNDCRKYNIEIKNNYLTQMNNKQKVGLKLFIFFIFFWIFESILKKLFPIVNSYNPIFCLFFFAIFLYLLFIKKYSAKKQTLLHFNEILSGLPKRGILFIGLLLIIITCVRIFKLDKKAADFLSQIIIQDINVFLIILFTVISVILLTEFFSNTIVSAAFFPIAYHISIACDINPLILMIAVSISSTCAFMTPIATPCNALAFGEMKNTSLKKMIISGFILNIAGAFLMAIWLQFVIPIIY